MLGQCSFNPLHPNISLQVLHTVFYAFLTYKENLFNNQEFLEFAINSFIDVILVFRSGGILLGEVRCFSLLVIKRYKKFDDLPLVKLVHWRLEINFIFLFIGYTSPWCYGSLFPSFSSK